MTESGALLAGEPARDRPGDAPAFGPESRGLPVSWPEERADRSVRIPIRPEARSLNLANAVAIGLFEAAGQIGGSDPAPCATPSGLR